MRDALATVFAFKNARFSFDFDEYEILCVILSAAKPVRCAKFVCCDFSELCAMYAVEMVSVFG